MVAIADSIPKQHSRFRFILDRRDVLGALFVEYLPTLSTHVSTRPGVPDFVYGAAIIVVMILLPTGAGGLIQRLLRPLTTWLYTRP